MRLACLLTVALTILVIPAWGQDEPREGRGDGPRRGGRGPGDRGFGRMSVEMAAYQLSQELELTDAQKELYDELVDKYQAQARSRWQFSPETRELLDEYRTARREGNEERAQELREQIRAERGERAERGGVVQEFFQEVETILEPQQVETLHAFRDRMQQAVQERMEMRDMLRRLPEELNLTDEQRAAYEAALVESRQAMRRRAEEWGEQRAEMQAELREAEASGDDARVAELQEFLMTARPPEPDPTAFFDQLEPLLDAEQKAKLATLRNQFASTSGQGADLQQIVRAVRRLKVDGKQRDELKEIIQTANRAERAGPNTALARQQRAAAVKEQVLQALTPEQREEFEKLLTRDARGPRPRGDQKGEGGSERRGRPRGGAGRGGDAS